MSYRNRPSSGNRKHRLVVAITGSSGSAYGLKLLQALRGISSIEVHLVVSSSAWITIHHEVGLQENDFKQLSDFYHPYNNIGAPIASGSFSSLGMVIAPCSVNTMSSIASGLADNLITRAAHVTIKEQRKLILMITRSIATRKWSSCAIKMKKIRSKSVLLMLASAT